jgi:hypothetical protein
MHKLFTQKLPDYTMDVTLIEPFKKQLTATCYQLHEQDIANEKLFKAQLTEVSKSLQTLKERFAIGKISEEMYYEFSLQYQEQHTGSDAKNARLMSSTVLSLFFFLFYGRCHQTV